MGDCPTHYRNYMKLASAELEQVPTSILLSLATALNDKPIAQVIAMGPRAGDLVKTMAVATLLTVLEQRRPTEQSRIDSLADG